MRVELPAEARHDLLEGAWFYEQQRERLPIVVAGSTGTYYE